MDRFHDAHPRLWGLMHFAAFVAAVGLLELADFALSGRLWV